MFHRGRGGIRTHGSFHFTRFPSVPIRPLSHPSSTSSPMPQVTQAIGKVSLSLITHGDVGGEVTVGSCATRTRESGQGRKAAAFSGFTCVPQTAWPLLHYSRPTIARSARSTIWLFPTSVATARSADVGPRHCQSSTPPS